MPFKQSVLRSTFKLSLLTISLGIFLVSSALWLLCSICRPNSSDFEFKMLNYLRSDPSNYKGPIARSWPPEKDRFLPNYIEGEVIVKCLLSVATTTIGRKNNTTTFHLDPFDITPASTHLTDIDLIVIVQSSPGNFTQRSVIRQTWGSTGMNNGFLRQGF